VNVSDPAAVDPKMTANLLQEHGITATGSLVRFVCLSVPSANQDSAHTSRRSKPSQTPLPDRATCGAHIGHALPAVPCDHIASVVHLLTEGCSCVAQGLSFDADVSSEDAEVVERGKARLRQALQVCCWPSAARRRRK